MDDVLLHDSNDKDHLEYLKMICLEIREAELKLKHSKHEFFKNIYIV